MAARIRDEIQKNVAEAGIEVVEARITYLAYAPETRSGHAAAPAGKRHH